MTLELPPLTRDPLLHVDLTPNADLALRILRAYRANCDSLWEVRGLSEERTLIYKAMNEHQRERAVLLDQTIERLESQ